MNNSNPITLYGLTPVPSSTTTLLSPFTSPFPAPPHHPTHTPFQTLPIPQTPLSARINAYALANLTPATYNHSRRVYHYGIAIRNYRFPFPEWGCSDETWFCACLLHDIGTVDKFLERTRLSYEFAGGVLALRVLQEGNKDLDVKEDGEDGVMDMDGGGGIAPQDQAESIAEAIIRHQDLCEKGKITALGQLLQLATLLDNIGAHQALVHPSTIEDISRHFPRMKWSSCFADIIRKENTLKPWAHTTTLGEDEFPGKVLRNTLMAPYE